MDGVVQEYQKRAQEAVRSFGTLLFTWNLQPLKNNFRGDFKQFDADGRCLISR